MGNAVNVLKLCSEIQNTLSMQAKLSETPSIASKWSGTIVLFKNSQYKCMQQVPLKSCLIKLYKYLAFLWLHLCTEINSNEYKTSVVVKKV